MCQSAAMAYQPHHIQTKAYRPFLLERLNRFSRSSCLSWELSSVERRISHLSPQQQQQQYPLVWCKSHFGKTLIGPLYNFSVPDVVAAAAAYFLDYTACGENAKNVKTSFKVAIVPYRVIDSDTKSNELENCFSRFSPHFYRCITEKVVN